MRMRDVEPDQSGDSRQVEAATRIMSDFADQTGLTSNRTPRRYLWTDAFAVCNYLELYRRTSDTAFLSLAVRLMTQVHEVLGRHRDDDERTGWLSGLDRTEAERHPTIAGLRIGKKLPERRLGEPYDQRLEWDRDGQYYHYLTKWMHALNRLSHFTGNADHKRWAVELAEVIHKSFMHVDAAGSLRGLYWKMSIDLERPLVTSMGQHDALDGLVTYEELDLPGQNAESRVRGLEREIADLREMCEAMIWETGDPLGVGALLTDTYRLAQLVDAGQEHLTEVLVKVVQTTLRSLQYVVQQELWSFPPRNRLAFRELGLVIGVKAINPLTSLLDRATVDIPDWSSLAPRLGVYVPFGEEIQQFWLDRRVQQNAGWREHSDINMVMLATTLVPDAYLTIR